MRGGGAPPEIAADSAASRGRSDATRQKSARYSADLGLLIGGWATPPVSHSGHGLGDLDG